MATTAPKQLTTQALIAAILARETSMPVDDLVDAVKRVHASASIIRSFPPTAETPSRAAARANRYLAGTSWSFDVSDRSAPAIVKQETGERIVLV